MKQAWLVGAALAVGLAGAEWWAGRDAPQNWDAWSNDFTLAAQHLEGLRQQGERLYRTEAEFVAAFAASNPELQATHLVNGAWLDPWGSPIHYRYQRLKLGGLGESVRIYSDGQNRKDDRGYGDDIPLSAEHPAGAKASLVLTGFVDER